MKIKILFFGSSAFSLDSLIEIAKNPKFEIVGIVTGGAKKIGKKQIVQRNVVAEKTVELGISNDIIFEIYNLKSDELFEKISAIKFDIGVVVSFGYLIPSRYIELPAVDMINLHPSSLPMFRGASPIQKSIQSGLKIIDICIIKIVPKMDEGDILMKESFHIGLNAHASDVFPQISKIGGMLMNKAAEYLYENRINIKNLYTPQQGDVSYAEKIKQEDLIINFEESVDLIYNKIRANNLDGCMYFVHKEKPIKIYSAEMLAFDEEDWASFDKNIGSLFGLLQREDGKYFLYCKNGKIKPLLLQQAGKKILSYEEFFRGFR
jgi:methionyl-tRNA formyltransferase